VNIEKLRGFSAKSRNQAGLIGIDPGWLDLDPLDLDLTAARGCGYVTRRV
jgi:hypothetical protein